ncbi:MAG: hypothetical protein HC896_14825 [Bacteroidales bacterium]|nr:hypothetical protein [Bacteroidales bacterium]
MAMFSIRLYAGVEKIAYRGYTNCYRIYNDSVELVIVPEAGGRVLKYALNNKNIIFENTSQNGKLLDDWLNNWFDPDGGRFDLGPEGVTNNGSERPHDTIYMGAYAPEVTGRYSLKITSMLDQELNVLVTRDFTLDSLSSHATVKQSVINKSQAPSHYYHWGRTLCPLGGTIIMPLHHNSAYALGWGDFKSAGGWAFNTANPSQPYATVHDSVLTLKPPATGSNKFGVDANDGWIAYGYNDLLMVKKFKHFPEGLYKEPGAATIVSYYNGGGKFVELEPIGPEAVQNYNDTATFEEHWWLLTYKGAANVHDNPAHAINFLHANTQPIEPRDLIVPTGHLVEKLSIDTNFWFY